jgi:hypothetical protein
MKYLAARSHAHPAAMPYAQDCPDCYLPPDDARRTDALEKAALAAQRLLGAMNTANVALPMGVAFEAIPLRDALVAAKLWPDPKKA